MPSQNSNDSAGRPKTPQRRRGRDRVAALLDAAATVFVEQGYEAATMTQVAAQAGAPIGSLYQFFPSKTALAETLHVRELEALSAALERVDGVSTKEGLGRRSDRILGALLAFVAEHPVFTELAERRDIDPARKAETRHALRAQIAKLLSASEPRVSAPRLKSAAALVLIVMKAIVALRAEDGGGETSAALTGELRRMIRQYLTAGGS